MTLIKKLYLIPVIALILYGCSSAKISSDTTLGVSKKYSNLSYNHLKLKNDSLVNEISYFKVTYFLNQVEQLGYSYMPLTKIKNDEVKSYWETIPELQYYYSLWQKASESLQMFQDKYDPRFRELSYNWHKKNVNLEDYYKQHRKLAADLRMKFPETYPELIKKNSKSKSKMWLESGKYMLNEYKKEKKEFPTYWIPDVRLKTLNNDKAFRNLIIEKNYVQTELTKKTK